MLGLFLFRARPAAALAALLLAWPALELHAATFSLDANSEIGPTKHRIRAAQFLSQATFGASNAEIEALASRSRQVGILQAYEEWIDNQFTLPVTRHSPTVFQMLRDDFSDVTIDGETVPPALQRNIQPLRYRYLAWSHNAMTAQDQLRQRTAWALIQIFVMGNRGAGFGNIGKDGFDQPMWMGLSRYYDMLLNRSFDNYRTLLGAVSRHPNMGVYLSHVRNAKAELDASGNPIREPDENYAREVMQLFTIGLYRINRSGDCIINAQGELIPTYDNDDIKAFARVFTGLDFAGNRAFGRNRTNFHQQMVSHDAFHDQDEKRLLRGTVLSPGRTTYQDISAALNNLFEHPNCPQFVSRLLIQRFTQSNPSRGYIRRVTSAFEDNGMGVRGDMKAVIKAILLDSEARNPIGLSHATSPARVFVTLRGTEYSKLREPILRYTAFLKAFNATSTYHTGRFMIPTTQSLWGQGPFGSPSVFNFYLPDHQPAGPIISYQPSNVIPQCNGVRSLFAPEFQILNAVTANNTLNRYRADVVNSTATHTIWGSVQPVVRAEMDLDFSEELAVVDQPGRLVQLLDLKLCAGTLSNQTRQKIVTRLQELPDNNLLRVRCAVLAVVTSPDCAISH